jgi:CBS-domain-containing membrane protein
VTEVLAAQDQAARQARSKATGLLPCTRRQAAQHAKHTAGQLMTKPAITVHPDAPIARAVALMRNHHVKRLPAADPQGTLIGIVSLVRDDEVDPGLGQHQGLLLRLPDGRLQMAALRV